MRSIQAIKTDNYGKIPMNKRFLQWRVLLLLLAILAFLPGAVWPQQGTPPVAVIININGKADFRANDKADWKPAKVKDGLWQGYQLRTETGNKAVILYNATGARVLVNENTQIEVQAQATTTGGKPPKDRTRLMMGEIYSQVTKNNYEVETPSSVASVRGTKFDSKYDPDSGEATYLVMQNVVEVRDLMNQFAAVLLKQMQMTTAKKNEAPKNPTDVSKDDANKRTTWTKGAEPKWKLNMVPEGGVSHEVGTTFTLSLYTLDAKTGSMDSGASLDIKSFTASSDIIDFSTDRGKNWTTTPQIKITGGAASLLARVKAEGTVEITATADNAQPASSTLTVAKAKQRRTIDINFADPNGQNPKTLTLELEEK